MVIKNKISNVIGPSGIFAGYILFIAGLAAVWLNLSAIPLIILGAFLAFSHSRSFINLGDKRYKILFFLFGIIPFGKEHELDPEDNLSVRHVKGVYTSYSMSNRRSSVGRDAYLVMLQRGIDRKNITLASFRTEKDARDLRDKIQVLLSGD